MMIFVQYHPFMSHIVHCSRRIICVTFDCLTASLQLMQLRTSGRETEKGPSIADDSVHGFTGHALELGLSQ